MRVEMQPPIGVMDETGWHLTDDEDAQLQIEGDLGRCVAYSLSFRSYWVTGGI